MKRIMKCAIDPLDLLNAISFIIRTAQRPPLVSAALPARRNLSLTVVYVCSHVPMPAKESNRLRTARTTRPSESTQAHSFVGFLFFFLCASMRFIVYRASPRYVRRAFSRATRLQDIRGPFGGFWTRGRTARGTYPPQVTVHERFLLKIKSRRQSAGIFSRCLLFWKRKHPARNKYDKYSFTRATTLSLQSFSRLARVTTRPFSTSTVEEKLISRNGASLQLKLIDCEEPKGEKLKASEERRETLKSNSRDSWI